MTLDDVRTFYARENTRLFGGALPASLELRVGGAEMVTARKGGLTHIICRRRGDGLWDMTPEWLAVKASILDGGGELFRITMLHEMAHVAVCARPQPGTVHANEGHEGAFFVELQRLQVLGEDWVPKEIDGEAHHASNAMQELMPLGWEELRELARADETVGLDPAGWEERLRTMKGVTFAELERSVTGAPFWYAWLRVQVRQELDFIATCKLRQWGIGS